MDKKFIGLSLILLAACNDSKVTNVETPTSTAPVASPKPETARPTAQQASQRINLGLSITANGQAVYLLDLLQFIFLIDGHVRKVDPWSGQYAQQNLGTLYSNTNCTGSVAIGSVPMTQATVGSELQDADGQWYRITGKSTMVPQSVKEVGFPCTIYFTPSPLYSFIVIEAPINDLSSIAPIDLGSQ